MTPPLEATIQQIMRRRVVFDRDQFLLRDSPILLAKAKRYLK